MLILNLHTQYWYWKCDSVDLSVYSKGVNELGNHKLKLKPRVSPSTFLKFQSAVSRWLLEVLM